jgi:hypothetical protein
MELHGKEFVSPAVCRLRVVVSSLDGASAPTRAAHSSGGGSDTSDRTFVGKEICVSHIEFAWFIWFMWSTWSASTRR